MKRTKISALVLAASMAFGTFSGTTAYAADTQMTIDTSSVIRTASRELYGLSVDYSTEQKIIKVAEDGTFTNNGEIVEALNEAGIPVVRLGESATREGFEWKDAVGDYADRKDQTLWGKTAKVAEGPLEQINFYEEVDSSVAFTVTVNMMGDTAADAGDLAEFLKGDANTEWGAKRIAAGHTEPVNVRLYELGNETDWDGSGTNKWTVDTYIAKVKEFIAEIKVADPNAKFAVHADSTAYNSNRSGESWRDWHKAILSDSALAEEIDYISLHAYFEPDINNGVSALVADIETDIKNITGSDRIKVYLSEYAVYLAEDGSTNPHNLRSVINTANVLSRLAIDPSIEITAYHGLDSSEWRNIVYKSEITAEDVANDPTLEVREEEAYLNGIGQMLKTFKEYAVGSVVSSTYTGFSKNGAHASSSGIAVKTGEGVNLIFTNETDAAIPVNLNFSDDKEYKLKKQTVITRENSSIAVGDADITYDKNNITVTKSYSNDEGSVTSYTIPAYSVCAVALEEKSDKVESVLWNVFPSESYQVYKTAVEVPDAVGTAEVSGNKLVLSGVDDSYEYRYVYLPYNNENTDFTFKADVQVNTLDGAIGIVLNSDVNNALPSGNMLVLDAESIQEVSVKDGLEGNEIAKSSAKIAAGNTYSLSVTKKGDTITAELNGTELYTRSGSFANATGYAGFMFNEAKCTISNVEFVRYEDIEKVHYARSFTYEEDFTGIADGQLPEGWETMSARAIASVQDGELVLESKEWYAPAWIKIPGLENVNRNGLVMEADIRLISYDAFAKSSGVRNQGGFAYMAEGDKISTTGMLTWDWEKSAEDPIRTSQTSQYEYGLTDSNGNPEITGGQPEPFFSTGETKKMKLVFGGTSSPAIYINDVKCTPAYPFTDTTNNMGAIGLQARCAKVAFDNIKVSGTTRELMPKEDFVYSDFTYEENFDSYGNGTTPAGFTPIDANASAVIEDGQLKVITTGAWYEENMSGVLIDSLKNVKREGLTIELDMTLEDYTVDQYYEGGQPGAAVLLQGDEKLEHYRIRAEKDEEYNVSWLLVRDGLRLQSSWDDGFKFANGNPINLKLVFNGAGDTAVGYVDGVQRRTGLTVANYKEDKAYKNPAIEEFQIGLGGNATVVKFDNIKITGKKLMPKTEADSISAVFASGETVFATAEEAMADVKVTYFNYETGTTDVSADATKTVEAKADGSFDIVISYAGKTTVLNFTTVAMDYYDFVYEENFDSYANGVYPDGFTVTGSAAAVIEDGQLKVNTRGSWDKQAGVLIDSLKNVKRAGLSVELDMTLVEFNGQAENGGVQTGASVLLTDGTNTGYYMLTAKPYVEGEETRSFIWVRDSVWANGNPIGNEFTSNEKITLKLVFDADGKTATGYKNGTQIRTPLDIASLAGSANDLGYAAINEFQLGLGGNETTVLIDNIKITGKKKAAVIENSNIAVAAKNFDTASGKLSVSVDLQDRVSADSNVYLAVYEKATGKLVGLDMKAWNPTTYKLAKLNLAVSDIAGYSAETHDVKVMAIEKTSQRPVAVFAEF